MTHPSSTAAHRDRGDPSDPALFRRVLGSYPTGVVVVTAMAPGDTPVGMVIGSFTSVSLDPPLVAFLPGRSSTTWPDIRASGAFCVNVLSGRQEGTCRDFTAKAPDRFAPDRWRSASSGSPILAGVLAWIDCDIADVQITGDHYFVLGRVRELGTGQAAGAPLVFFQSRLSPLPPHRGGDCSAAYEWPDWL